jgi:hypothetical protein
MDGREAKNVDVAGKKERRKDVKTPAGSLRALARQGTRSWPTKKGGKRTILNANITRSCRL